MLVKQPGDLCVRSKVSKGERGRRGGQGGDAVGRAWPCGPREDFREVGALKGCGQRGVGCSPAPSGGFFGEDPPRTRDGDERQDGGCGRGEKWVEPDSKGLCPQSCQVTLEPLPPAVKNQPESQSLLSSAVGWASASQHSFLPIRSLPPTPVPRPIPALSSVEI